MASFKLRLPKSVENALGKAAEAIDVANGLRGAFASASGDLANARPSLKITSSGIEISLDDTSGGRETPAAGSEGYAERNPPRLGDGHDGYRHRNEDQAVRTTKTRGAKKKSPKSKPVGPTKRKRKKRAAP